MPSLLDIIRAVKPERSLLLSYAAPPLVVETLLLRSLQSRGLGDVIVLVDEGAYREALIEAESARWAGVHYEYLPVRVGGSGVFHPKFYLLLARDGAHLLVSSANLSPSSLHENAEVLDHLILPDEGPGDAAAFLDAADFLLALARLPEDSLPAQARVRLAEFQSEIEERALGAAERSGARLLHSIGRPLLDRLAEAVEPSGVAEIVVISPFFDAECRALLALAERFGNARICVVTRDEATDLHRDRLAGIRGRLDVHAFPAGRLRLHAKSLLLQGDAGSWLFSGSANLTAPAWFPRAGRGSNVEVGVLRHSTHRGAFPQFGRAAAGAAIPWDQMTGRVPAPAGEPEEGTLVLWVREAVEEDGAVRIVCRAEASWAAASARVRFASARAGADLAASVAVEGDALVITASFPDAEGAEGSVTARVELRHPDGRRAEATAWLYRPRLAKLPARERRWRRMVVDLEAQGWDDDPEGYETFLDLCRAMLDMLQGRAQPGPGPKPAAAPAEPHLPGGPRDSRSGAVPGLLERVARALHRAMAGGAVREMAERHRRRGGRGREGRGRSASERGRAARQDFLLVRLTLSLFSVAPAADTLDDVALQLDVHVRLLLRRLAARLAEPQGKGKPGELAAHFPQVLAHAFSLEGAERGEPTGWFLHLWSRPELREELHQVFRTPERRAVLLYLLALAQRRAARTGAESAETGEARMRGILAGICLVMGEAEPWAEPVTRTHIEQLAGELSVASDDLPTGQAVAESLPRLARAPIPQLRMVRRFLGLLRADAGLPLRQRGALEERYRALRAQGKRTLYPVLTPDARPTCGACFRVIPAARWGEIQTASDHATCPHCGVVLTPFADAARAESLLGALETLQASERAA